MGWRGYKFPEQPPDIDPEALYEDPIALVEFREWKTRRKFIEIEKAKASNTSYCEDEYWQIRGGSRASLKKLRHAKVESHRGSMFAPGMEVITFKPALQILRERVKKCYKEEGVNHQQNCQRHVLNYLESIKNIGNHVANSGEHDLNREQMKARMFEK